MLGDGDGAGPLRIGIVGCGGISEWHAAAARAAADAAIVACCDVRHDVAAQWAERYGCERAYEDYATMVREHELDAVLLATWPVQHREQIFRCLEEGARAILCEKALTLSSREALEVWQATRDAGALVMEGFMYRHHPAILRIDELLAAGEIGDVDTVLATFDWFDAEEDPADDASRDWRRRKEAGGGIAYDIVCYCVNAINHWAGALPVRATAWTSTSAKYGTIDRLYGLVEYENGVVGIVESSNKSEFNYGIKVSGSTGQIELPVAWRPVGETNVLLHRGSGPFEYRTTPYRVAEADAYHLQLERFAAAVRGAAQPMPGLAESVVDALTLDALLRSGEERAAAAIEIPSGVREELAAAAV